MDGGPLDGGLILFTEAPWTADRQSVHDKILKTKPMLVDFSDGMKLDGEPKPIMVDLSDEKKPPWMFTLDGLILRTASFLGRPHSLDGLILWTASFFGRTPCLNGLHA